MHASASRSRDGFLKLEEGNDQRKETQGSVEAAACSAQSNPPSGSLGVGSRHRTRGFKQIKDRSGWACSSVECLPRMHEALGSILSTL